MSRQVTSPTEIEYRVLDALQALDGVCWQQALGEYHAAHGEIAVWILLRNAADIEQAHDRFRDVIAAYCDLVRFTVSYSLRTPEGEILLDALSGNEEIGRAGTLRPLGRNPTASRSGVSVFRP